ncbi:MAG TPA: hypothetical protein VMT47_05640 [Polyangia bacterium]|nr:hypothetical protein [Polyangia bacterium]
MGISFDGAHANSVHEVIAATLEHHGFETISVDLADDSEGAIARGAKEGKLVAVLTGEVREGGKRFKLRVYGASGDLIGESSWADKGGVEKLLAAIERTLWARVGSSLAKAHVGGADAMTEARSDRKGAHNDEGQDKAEREESQEAARAGAHDKAHDDAPEEEKASRQSRSKAESSDEGEESPPPRKRRKKRAAVEVEAEAADESARAAGTALDIAVGPRLVSHSIVWNPLASALYAYSLALSPSLGGAIAWYPAAHVTSGWASNLGLATSIEYTPGLVSQTSDGLRYPTTESDYWGGVRGRLLAGAFQAALTVGGGQHTFILHSDGAAQRSLLMSLPDVKYTYLRAGLDLRVALPANIALMLGGGYRYVLSAGDHNYLLEASSYFPNATFLAFDVTASAAYRFLPAVEARAGFDLRRYQMTAGANNDMVDSATDQYVSYWVQLAVIIEGAAAEAPEKLEKPRRRRDDDE